MTATLGHTEQLASFAHGLKLSEVPREVVDKVKVHILDQIGAELLGAGLPWSRSVREYCLKYGAPGGCMVVGVPETRDAEFAALSNGTAGHGFEIDDYHAGTGHPGCVAVPTSLAVGEEQASSGADFLLATIIDFEIISRVTVAAMPSMIFDRGFHGNCALGVFGSSAATARLMKLTEAQLLAAMAIAGSHSSGTVEYSQSGGEVKRLHAGMGATAGIRSARIAALGLTGPRTILEGKKGFLQAFSADPHPAELTKELGKRWELMECLIKPYSCCGIIFQMIDALKGIIDEHALEPSQIRAIRVGADRLSNVQVGAIGPEPVDMSGAQFSAHFSLGITAVKGQNDFGTYLDVARGQFKDPEILRIARGVTLELDPECDALFPDRWLAKVEVTTADGRILKGQADGKRAVSASEVEAKFRTLAERVMPASQYEKIIEAVMQVEKLAGVRELSQLLAVSSSAYALA